MTGTDFSSALRNVADGNVLTDEEMEAAMAALLAGHVDPAAAGAFLMGLKVRGETPAEIAAAARAMRAAATRFEAPAGTVDTCGTGGDGAQTYNISTATAILLAAAGVPVAKHGNKAVSSASGSSDVLSALGARIDIGPEAAERVFRKTGLGFFFAPHHHPAVRHVAPVRAALGVRTLFNLLGPLTNPGGARRQLLGVYDQALLRPLAETLRGLGAEAAWIVHGSDGLDELTVTGPSHAAVLTGGEIKEIVVRPEDAGLTQHAEGSLRGGSPDENAEALRALLSGAAGAYRDAVLLNGAAGLIVAGKEEDLKPAAARLAQLLDDGTAKAFLETFIAATQQEASSAS